MTEHRNRCEAPICADEITDEEMEILIWYPGELVCTRTPRTKWQRQQLIINKFVEKEEFEYTDFYFTANILDGRSHAVQKTTKGLNPDIPAGSTKAITV